MLERRQSPKPLCWLPVTDNARIPPIPWRGEFVSTIPDARPATNEGWRDFATKYSSSLDEQQIIPTTLQIRVHGLRTGTRTSILGASGPASVELMRTAPYCVGSSTSPE